MDSELKLAQQIAELRGIVVEGFKGTHLRQDTTNGRVLRLEARVGELEVSHAKDEGLDGRVDILEKSEEYRKGESKGVSMTWGRISAIIVGSSTIIGIVIAILDYLLKRQP